MKETSKIARLASRSFRAVHKLGNEFFVAGPDFLWGPGNFESEVPAKYVRFLSSAHGTLADHELVIGIFDNSRNDEEVGSAVVITDRQLVVFESGRWVRVPYDKIVAVSGLPTSKDHARSDLTALEVLLADGDRIRIPARFGYVYSLWGFLKRPAITPNLRLEV